MTHPTYHRVQMDDRQLPTSLLNRHSEDLEALRDLSGDGAGLDFGVPVIPVVPPESFLAQITAGDGSTPRKYTWRRWLDHDEDGASFYDPSDITGGPGAPSDLLPAYEHSGNPDVPVDGTAIVRMWPSWGGECYLFHWQPLVGTITSGAIVFPSTGDPAVAPAAILVIPTLTVSGPPTYSADPGEVVCDPDGYLWQSNGTDWYGYTPVKDSDYPIATGGIPYVTGTGTFAGSAVLFDPVTGTTTYPAGTTGGAPLNLGVGVAPTSPDNGDVWVTATGIFARVGGVTYNLTTGGAAPGGSAGNVQYNDTGSFGGASNVNYGTHPALTVNETGNFVAELADSTTGYAGKFTGDAEATLFYAGTGGVDSSFAAAYATDGAGRRVELVRNGQNDCLYVTDGTQIAYFCNGTVAAFFAGDIQLATATGTKFGTAANQLLGFWGATPVDQPAAVADVATADAGATYGTAERDLLNEIKAQLNALLARLRESGIIAT